METHGGRLELRLPAAEVVSCPLMPKTEAHDRKNLVQPLFREEVGEGTFV